LRHVNVGRWLSVSAALGCVSSPPCASLSTAVNGYRHGSAINLRHVNGAAVGAAHDAAAGKPYHAGRQAPRLATIIDEHDCINN